MTPTSVRVAAVARCAYAVLLLTRTRDVLVRVHGLSGDPREVTVLRVLGVRHLAQGAVTVAAPTRTVARAGALSDLLHGASMLLLAALSPAHRRAGLVESGIASTWALASDIPDVTGKFPV